MINGSDMLNIRKSMQSSTLQLIQDIEEILSRNNGTVIPIFIPKLLYYTTDWDTMAIFFRSRHLRTILNKNIVRLNGVDGFILQIIVDKDE